MFVEYHIYLHFEMFKYSLLICSHSLILFSSLSISVLASMFRLLFSKLPNVLKKVVSSVYDVRLNILLDFGVININNK